MSLESLTNYFINRSNADKTAVRTELTGSKIPLDGTRKLYPISDPVKLTIPTFDDSGEAIHGNVIRVRGKFAGYEYWMAMTPYPGLDPTNEKVSILASTDGIAWVVPAGITNPIVDIFSPDPYLVHDPDANKLYVYYVREDGGTNLIRRKGISAALVVGDEENTNIYHLSPSVIYEASNWWVLFGMQGNGIKRYVSADGLTWVLTSAHEIACNNLMGDIWHNSVMADPSGYHFLSTMIPRGYSSSRTILYYGHSRDGWVIDYDAVPLVVPKDGSWYSKAVYLSCLVPIGDNKYRVYMSGISESGVVSIGYMDVQLSAWGIGDISPRSSRIVLFNNLEIAAGASVYTDYFQFAGTPWAKYSLSGNGSKSYEVHEAFYLADSGTTASKADASLASSTGFYNSAKLDVVSPRIRWGIKNTHATDAGNYTLTLMLYPR